MDLIIKEEDSWEVTSAVLCLIRQALKTNIITKSEVDKVMEEF